MGRAEHPTEYCADMAHVYRMGGERTCPRVPITFDRYHVMQKLSHVVDEVSAGSRRTLPSFKRSR